jgi:parvulin-like peptidyl-prolyl isomerase
MRPVLCMLGAFALCACSGPSEEAPEVLAQVGDRVITVEQFEQELATRAMMRPGYYDQAERRRQLLEDLINHRVQLNAAEAAGIPDEPAFSDLVERMMIQRLRERRLESSLAEMAITDAEVVQYYEANQDQFTRPERRQIALIRINRPAREEEEDLASLRTRAEEARTAAEALADDVAHFGAVAVDYSDDRSSRYQGGVVGWLVDSDQAQYRLDPAVIAAAFELNSAGEISPVIETASALWLVRLVALEAERRQPLTSVAEGIRHRLTRQRAAELEEGLIDGLRSEQTININEAALASVPVPESIPRERQPEDGSQDSNRRPPPLPGGSAEQDALDDDSAESESHED